MRDVLTRIKRVILDGRCIFSVKAGVELEADHLSELDALEAIESAGAITKTIRSRSPLRSHAREKLYVIQSTNFEGVLLYTKGKFVVDDNGDTFYVVISAKKSE